eukprot:4661290-Pyramimonas_sp.AAC.1
MPFSPDELRHEPAQECEARLRAAFAEVVISGCVTRTTWEDRHVCDWPPSHAGCAVRRAKTAPNLARP